MEASKVYPELQYISELNKRIQKREESLRIIPPRLLRVIQRFPNDHFRLLQFLARYPSALELMESNPMLGFMVATYPRWRTGPAHASEKEIEGILHQKRRNVLTWLGFPMATEATVNMVGKVDAWACRTSLVAAMHHPPVNSEGTIRLAHLKRINLGVMSIFASAGLLEHVTNSFLEAVAHDPKEDREAIAACELEACLQLMMDTHERYVDRVFQTPAHARRFLLKFSDYLLPDEITKFNISLPAPPFPETRTIQALRTPRDVAEEAMEQGNCVWSLLPEIAGGRLCLYRLLKPERATLSIAFKGGTWKIGQIESAYGSPVEQTTLEYVDKWFSDAASKIPRDVRQ